MTKSNSLHQTAFPVSKKITTIVFFWGLLLCQTYANGSTLYFNNLTVNNGLPTNITSNIETDIHGFIWIGTHDGLCRFDGKRFVTFRHHNSGPSIESNQISALLNNGNDLWAGSWSGLSIINTTTFEITQIDIGTNNAVRVLHKGVNGYIWIGTSNGLMQYDTNLKSVKTFTTNNSSLSHNTIRSIHQQVNGDIWIGTYNKLNRLANDSIKSYDLKGDYKPLLKNNLVIAIQSVPNTGDSLLWIGTETGLCLLNCNTGSYTRYSEKNSGLSNDVVKCIHVEGHQLWLGTDFGLNIFDLPSKSFTSYFHNPNQFYSLANNVVWEILRDKTGVIWLVTSSGISYTKVSSSFFQFHEVSYTIHDEPAGNQIKDILDGNDGTIWMATVHGLLKQTTNKQEYFTTDNETAKRLLLNNVYTLAKDKRNRIWIGTAGGINVLDEKQGKMHAITASPENGLTSNYIGKLFHDNKGRIWASAWEGGLFVSEGDLAKPEHLTFRKVNNFGGDKYTFDGENIWYANHESIFKVNSNSFITNEIDELRQYVANKTIECITLASNNNMWIGAKNLLLNYNTSTGSIKQIPLIDGIDNHIIGILEDGDDNIWATTYNTLIFLPKNDSSPIFIPINEGLPLKSFYSNCNAITQEGNLLFGGDNGYIEINPKQFQSPRLDVPVYITHIEINNQTYRGVNKNVNQPEPISFIDKIELNSNHRSLLIEFAALDYSQPQKNIYAYKLEGFDDDWQYTNGERNFAVYSNLPANDYQLKIKGTSSYGVWLNNSADLNIVVHPSIWLSKWFMVLYFLILVSIAFIALKINTFRVKMLNEVRISKLEKEHNDELIATKQQFFTNISHELKTPLNLILSPLNQLLGSKLLDKKSSKMLSLAQKNTQRLLWLVNQILDFRKMEVGKVSLHIQQIEMVAFCNDIYEMYIDYAERLGFKYEFSTNVKSYSTAVDKDKFSIVIFNLLSNAFKYAEKGSTIKLGLEIRQIPFEADEIIITVKNRGRGINSNDLDKIFDRFYQADNAQKGMGSGVGLTIARDYVNLHKGTIEVESVPDEDTIFTIKLKTHTSVDNIKTVVTNTVTTSNIESTEKRNDGLKMEQHTYSILAVDDNSDILSLLEMTLSQTYKVKTAISGEDALLLIAKHPPDLIISDVMMPGMDGITFCQNIRKNQATNHIPIILLTAKTQNEYKIEGVQAGADIYMTKPFDEVLLLETIKQLLIRRKELKQYIAKLNITEPEKTDSEEKNKDNQFLQKVISIIENNLTNDQLSVEFISKEVGISSTHLYRKLKSITNLSTNELIKKYRIKTASIMLKNKEGNATEIMYSVGFSNLSYFSKCFKAEFGCTPKEYQSKG